MFHSACLLGVFLKDLFIFTRSFRLMCVRRSTIHFKGFLQLYFPANSRTLIYFVAACCLSYCRVKHTLCHVNFLRFAQGDILTACHWPSCWIYMIVRLYLLICSAEASYDVKTAYLSGFHTVSVWGVYSSSLWSLHIDLTTITLNKTCYKLLHWVRACIRVCVCVCVGGCVWWI